MGLACGRRAHGSARGAVQLCNNTIKRLVFIIMFPYLFVCFFLSWLAYHTVMNVDLCAYVTTQSNICLCFYFSCLFSFSLFVCLFVCFFVGIYKVVHVDLCVYVRRQ